MAALSVSMNHVTTTIIFVVFLAQVTVMVNVCSANGDQSNILCHETEKQALLSFKRDLVDDYNKLVSWDVSEEEDCCKWAGISCNTLTGHVSELYLNYGSFTGKINPSLLNLTHLINLDLSWSNFEGIKIPSFMGSFVSLRYLNLTCGGFTGMIPHQLGNLSSLLYLGLGYNHDLYVENLHWVSGLSSLKSLVMDRVNLSKASDHWLFAINTLPSLQEVRLRHCHLGHIHFPSHINLTSLETLDLSDNSLDLGGPIC
ncbi:receptor-like protein EIX1 [Humulus lupulus]|uniref:receptor-like protein EIX1 n=1 Tax=Humulus lupulus TaxID=3486 RepID=UPI002B40E8C9|nr:receptor-like protein EIX1 [Humulus lupulus]